MNKIFKVVWSKSKNCYVVVSEFAKNNSGKKKIVVATIFAALAMSNASISMASNDVPSNLPATAVGLGPNASVKGDKAVGFGYNAAAAGGNSVVIGSNSSVAAGSPQGIAIGGGNTANEGARVIGEQAIAIGGNTIAQGNSSIVIGGDDVVKADGVKVIYTTNNGENKTGDLRSAVQSLTGFDMRNPLYTSATAGESGITLGMKGQSGNVGIAIGTGANAKDRLSGTSSGASGQANNDVTNAIAIGTGARANRDNAIAIGGGSNTDVGGTKQSSYTLPNNVVASWAGGDKTLPGDVVSFGSKGYERQLKHVAPGEVSATSTDAINGSQLSAIVDQIAYKYISIKSSDVANKDNTGATADNSIAIGPNAATDASASRSVAVGDGARGKVVDGVAVGSKSIADIASGVAGYNVNTSRTDIYAGLSGAALTSKLGGVAVGTINQTRQINYVAAGTADTDAVNVAQLKSVNLAFTGDTGTGDVNLANSKLAVNGDNTYISTTANGKKITVSGKKQDITVANGSATATAGMADSANVANAINQAIDQNKYGWNLSANGEATPVAVEKGNTVDFSGDDNVAVARNDKKISVALKKDLSKLNSASFNNASGNETVKIDGDKGINAGNLKVANVADGVADKDAVNVSQLKKVDDKAEANKTAIDTNKTAIDKNAVDIATNKDNIAANKTDIATNKDNIATNKANIDKNTTAIARKISLGGNSGSTDEKSLSTGDVKFNVKGENGLTTVANGDDVTVKLDDTTKGKIDNAADRDLSNLTPNGKQQVKDLAAWNVVANNETAEKVEGGNTVKFIDGDNIAITQAGKDFTIATKRDVNFDSVTVPAGAGNVVINNSGIKVLQPEQSQQFIYSNGAIANLQTGNMGMYKMRPQDVFQSQSLLNRLRQDNLLEPNTIDTTGAILGIGGDISSRSNNDPTNYLTKMLKAYRYANDHNSDYGSDEEDLYQTAGSVVKEQSIYKNPFMNFMSNHSYNIISSGQFSWKELLSLCPHLDQITKVVLPSQTSNQVMHNHGITLNANMLNSANLWSNENTEHWKGSTNETIAAYMISQALPAMMVEKLIASIRLRITNQTMTGEIQYSVDAVSPIDQIAGLLMPRHVEELVDRLKLETLGTITQGGVIPFDCLIDCSVFGDTFIQISINGGPHTPLLMPTFADSAASPVITTSVDNYNKVSNDVVNLARKLIGGNGYQQNVHSGVVVPNQQAPMYGNQPAQPIVQSNGQPFSDSLYN